MSDIKSVLFLLCQHLELSINVTIKPEHFRLAKFNSTAENVTEKLWTALDILSLFALREKQVGTEFQEYDRVSAVKLRFAYLQYPAVEFYAQTVDSNNNRQLLIAFAWLLGTQSILNTIVQINLANSVLGSECSQSKRSEKTVPPLSPPESLEAQMNNILHISGKVNYNIKEISELISEKVKLVSKVHAASINVSGLPHLSVSELALIKRISTINKGAYSKEDKKHLKELSIIGSLIDTHMKWVKKEHIFFEWMVTVIEEHSKSLTDNLPDISWREVSKFIFLLRNIIKEKLETLSSQDASINCQEYNIQCTSRLLRTQDSGTEASDWLTELTTRLSEEKEELSQKREELSIELKKILQLIPFCVQV